jgi:UDPglucose 6-dehydrogenase
MKLAVVGTGYVGLVAGTCLAETGNDVICVDIDAQKIDMLKAGKVPIYEPGLEEMVRRNAEDQRLSFTTDLTSAVQKSDVIFIAVGTPQGPTGHANLDFVKATAKGIAKALNSFKIIVTKSTVPVGTADHIKQWIAEETAQPFAVASNPEFMKEGAAVEDFMKPDRVVLGGDHAEALATLRELYEPFVRTGNPILVMDSRSAEMSKYAANAMLATKISFINEVARLCEERRYRRGAPGDQSRPAHRAAFYFPRGRLWRFLFSQGYPRHDRHGRRAARYGPAQSGGTGQRAAKAITVRQSSAPLRR